ncbi:gamma-tubulin complex component 3 homolog isoform X2 [Aphis gossypii]|uniref:gamma-tubulin complex component 3 homolog isoform X2 n=1 Tax=Aphis gossypii TaxID=80765 RepID=UPI00215948CE|nr:gamma-tubulin complex component 3 homolog isoform X2 [Aphis gossypii]
MVKYFGNTFTDELYQIIYTQIFKSHQGQTNRIDNIIMEQLQSPQKEQFISLFIELKTKNDPLDTNYVLRLCHKLLEQKKSNESLSYTDQINNQNKLGHQHFGQTQLKVDKRDRNETYGLIGDNNDNFSLPANRMNFSIGDKYLGTRIKCGRELLLNLTQYDQDIKWMESDKETALITIPNLEFVIKHVNELGRLHKIIKDYINTDSEHTGSVAKALRFSLQEKMNLYYVYVNNWLRANLEVLEHSKDNLRAFIPLDHNVLIRFKCLAKVVQNAKGKSGCNLISSVIHSSIREIENKMFNEITKPIQEKILRWMIDGEIEDKHGEFFIEENLSENYWNNSHTLSSTNTLDFLSEYQLNEIYQTGKNMKLLLKMFSPKIKTKIEKLRENIKILASNEDGLNIMLSDKCSKTSKIISDSCDQSSALLMEVLIDDYDLYQHFEGFRNYMLLGRGDFYTYVIHELEPYFGNSELYNYQLKDIIKNAYVLTSAGNDSKKLFNNLKYRIDITEKVNWDSIKFEYKTDEPLNHIFGPCLSHYANVFQFLWRLKNVDWITHKIWHELSNFVKTSFNMIELKSVLRNINAFLSNMLSCVNEIQNFMFEMIHDEWEQFKSEIHRATCVKTITDAHMSFLESITKCMEDGSVSLVAYVESLKIHSKRFSNVFYCFIDMTELLSENPKTRTYGALHEEMINDFMYNFRDIKNQYEMELCDFLIKLKGSAIRGLGTLALRIDFNGYYSSNEN